MQHCFNVVKGIEKPIETGEDGLEVLKIIYAAYQSAGEGRRIDFPYEPPWWSKSRLICGSGTRHKENADGKTCNVIHRTVGGFDT